MAKAKIVVIEAGPDYTDRLEHFEMELPEDEDQAVTEAAKAVATLGYSVIPNSEGGCNTYVSVSDGEDYIAITVEPGIKEIETLSAVVAELDRLSYGGEALSPQYPDMWATVAGSAEIQLDDCEELIVATTLGEIRKSIKRTEPEGPAAEVGYRLEQPGAYPQRITWGWVATGKPALDN